MFTFPSSILANQLAGDTDLFFNNVVLLLHMDGANNSTMFTDVKGKTVSTTADAKISTAQSRFGGASGFFDGTGDYLQVTNSADWDFSSGDFTIEAWVYRNSSGSASICSTSPDVVGSGWNFFIFDNNLRFEAGGGNPSVNSTLAVPISQWVFVSLNRSGTVFTFSVNGITQSITNASVFATNTQPLRIGANLHASFPYFFNGFIDDLRITKGIARTNYSPPTQAFPDS